MDRRRPDLCRCGMTGGPSSAASLRKDMMYLVLWLWARIMRWTRLRETVVREEPAGIESGEVVSIRRRQQAGMVGYRNRPYRRDGRR